MRAVFQLFLLSTCLNLEAQRKFVGDYSTFFGSGLHLKPDSSFEYTYRFDLYASWTLGTWTTRGDTILMKMSPVFDTVRRITKAGNIRDSIILSRDKIPELIDPPDPKILYSGGQSYYPYPEKLFYRKGKLYEVTPQGQIIKGKAKGWWTKRKYPLGFRRLKTQT